MSLTESIKDHALDLGYHAVGITSADPFVQFAQSLAQRAIDYEPFPYLIPFADAHNAMPGARSIVVCVYDYTVEGFAPDLIGTVGRLYQSRCYAATPDRIQGMRPQLMRQFLEKQGCQVGPWVAGRSGVSDRQASVRAGLARFGRNTFVCSEERGSFIMIHSFVIDSELDYDTPNEGLHCPPKCGLCREACPTGAIAEDLRLMPRRCIAFNTFTTRGEETGVSPYIPADIREKMGTWIHGCDICQQVCPKNTRRSQLPTNPYLERKAREFDLVSILHLTDDYYHRVVRPLMYNYIRDQYLFRRNAAVALGNQGDPETVPALARGLVEDDSEVVRAHVAWALGRIGGAGARAALEAQRSRETGRQATEEIAQALDAF